MNAKMYQQAAYRTLNDWLKEEENKEEALCDAVLGLCGEVEEFLEVLGNKELTYPESEHLRGDRGYHKLIDKDTQEILKEAGDIEWYRALFCTTLGIDFEDPDDLFFSIHSTNERQFLRASVGILAEKLKKYRYHGEELCGGKPLDIDQMRFHANRIGYCLNLLCGEVPMSYIWRMNIDKLNNRHGESFSGDYKDQDGC